MNFYHSSWFFGLIIVSEAFGAALSFVAYLLLSKRIFKEGGKALDHVGVVTGLIERFFFTCLIGLLGPSGIAQSAVAWIAIKGQINHKIFTDHAGASDTGTHEVRCKIYIHLLGSLVSILCALLGGYTWIAGYHIEGCFTVLKTP